MLDVWFPPLSVCSSCASGVYLVNSSFQDKDIHCKPIGISKLYVVCYCALLWIRNLSRVSSVLSPESPGSLCRISGTENEWMDHSEMNHKWALTDLLQCYHQRTSCCLQWWLSSYCWYRDLLHYWTKQRCQQPECVSWCSDRPIWRCKWMNNTSHQYIFNVTSSKRVRALVIIPKTFHCSLLWAVATSRACHQLPSTLMAMPSPSLPHHLSPRYIYATLCDFTSRSLHYTRHCVMRA